MLKLHLGCGNKHIDGYINIDIVANKSADIIADVHDLPFDDNSVDLIESYHMFEHLENPDLALRHWNKKLKIGGMLILELPDIGASLAKVYEKSKKIEDIWPFLYGRNIFYDDAKLSRLHYYSHPQQHKLGFDRPAMKKLLEREKFHVEHFGIGTQDGRVNDLSMRVEARKIN